MKKTVLKAIETEWREVAAVRETIRVHLLGISEIVGKAAEKVGIEYEDVNTWSYEDDDELSRLCIRSHIGVWGIYIENSLGDEMWFQSLGDVGNSDIMAACEHIFSLLEGYYIALCAEKTDLLEKQTNIAAILEASL